MKKKFLELIGAEEIPEDEINLSIKTNDEQPIGITILFAFAFDLALAVIFTVLFHKMIVTVLGMGISVLLLIILDFLLTDELDLLITKKKVKVYLLCLVTMIFVCFFVNELFRSMFAMSVYIKSIGVSTPSVLI